MTRKTSENRNTHIRSIGKQVLAGAKAVLRAETVNGVNFASVSFSSSFPG
jgi:hypothetical protein